MLKKDNPSEEVIINAFRTSTLLERISRNLVSKAGLTSLHQCVILENLLNSGDLSLKDLVEKTSVTKQNMTGMVDRLRLNGFVTTFDSPQDRRITLVRITNKGKQALSDANDLSAQSNKVAFKSFGQEDIIAFNHYLELMISNLINFK
ncbi:MarR family winged helix-turn-helix transcriptional regulator [Bacillus mojavensis]|uniref:MarR family winged helix-turn-helix transcriptional regulator n=1 Tax=Bacillus mojavensis TaxID=72360 RepID=UPI002DBD1EB7|nr:MarR family winged helix-turn-helix transcriptional regulator [Bacillus mojavensis]MEC1679645.1 MarR family winged helix-turn-helix transcriptional regulator [Bacillus mojavensis]MEC1713962.1 MarR family winged helix-turn-helix transcriptional regulator [Bacillus mojavensis]